MKKSLLVLTVIALIFSLSSHGQTKQREVGLVFSSLNSFGLTFRMGTDKSLWRFTALSVSGDNSVEKVTGGSSLTGLGDYDIKNTDIGFAIKAGHEWRKRITGGLEFRIGGDLSFTYSQSKTETDYKNSDYFDRLRKSNTYIPGINLVLGFNYVLFEHYVFGVEFMPGFSYSTGSSTEKNINGNIPNEIKSKFSGFDYGFSTGSVLLSVLYRFGKKK